VQRGATGTAELTTAGDEGAVPQEDRSITNTVARFRTVKISRPKIEAVSVAKIEA
jgi:hypothetical protein